MTTCFVCSDELTDNIYTLSSCDHGYHSQCLVDYFYTNATTFCPCCMNELSVHMSPDTSIDFATASRCARKKNAPKNIVNLYKRYTELRRKQTENNMAIRTFNAEDGQIYRPLQKRIRGLRRNKRMLRRRLQNVKRRMCRVANNVPS